MLQQGVQLLRVDTTLAEQLAKSGGYPVCIWAVTSFLTPGGDGLPLEAEVRLISQEEQELIGRVINGGQAVYIGSIQHAGQHVSVFHARQGGVLGPEPACRYQAPRYLWDVYYNNDPAFEFLTVKMLPTAKEQRRIKDAEILQLMCDAGDNPDVPRPITFYGLFPDPTSASECSTELSRGGFRPTNPSELPGRSGYGWSMMFTRTAQTDPEDIERFSSMAQEICLRYGGMYDGWECAPIPMPDAGSPKRR